MTQETFSKALYLMECRGKKMRSIYWGTKDYLFFDTFGDLKRNSARYQGINYLTLDEIMGSWVEVR